MKKGLCYALIMVMLISLFPVSGVVAAESSGICGENLTWVLDENGTLTISGTGAMYNNFEYNDNNELLWEQPDIWRTHAKSVVVGEGITYIGEDAFDECRNVNDISLPKSLTRIGAYAFLNCENITNIIIPNNVATIGDGAFAGCGLINVTIPDNVISLEGNAFMFCNELASISVSKNNSNYSDINGILFDKCLTTLIAYPAAKQDTSYTIPDGVIAIGTGAFGNGRLKTIIIPDSVTEIEGNSFLGAWITDIIVAKKNTNYCDIDGILYDKSLTTLIRYPEGKDNEEYIIPNSITTVTDGALVHCKFTTVTIPHSIKYIGGFYDCYKLTDIYYLGSESEWNKIRTPDWGTTIGEIREDTNWYNEYISNATIHYNSNEPDNSLFPDKDDRYNTTNRFGQGVSIKVSGASGVIPNAKVQIGDTTVTTNSSGIAEFPNVELRKKYIVKVTADGYFSKTMVDTFYNNTRDITLLSKTDNIYISSVFYGKGNNVYGDLMNNNTVTIENTDSSTYFIQPNVDWGNNPIGTMTLYGKNSKKSLVLSGNRLDISIGTQFDAGEKFLLILKTNGKTYTQDLKLRTQALPENVNISLPDIKSASIPNDFPFLGGNSFVFKLDLTEAINTAADVKIEDNKAVITLDYGDDEIKQQYAQIFGDKAVKGTIGAKIEIPIDDLSGGKWAGYITFKSGNKEKNKDVAQYLDLASVDKTFWLSTPMGMIPTYMSLDLSASLDTEVGVEYQKPNWNITGKIKPGLKGKFSGGLGIAYDTAEITVGPYGRADLKADVALNPISVQPKVKLDFGMQLTAKAWFIDAKAEFGMGKWEWPNANKMMLMSSDASDLQLMERDDEKPSEFFPHEISMFSTGNQVGDNNTKILSNVFPSVQAQPVTVNGKDILLFTNDNIARETQNGLTLMYSEKEDGIWNTPKAVADDGTLDSQINADGKFVVWENTKTILDANESNFVNIMGASEIAVARYNGNGYDAPIILTDNAVADFSPVVAANGDCAIVAWLSNTESDIFSQNGTTSICYRCFDGTKWEETQYIDNVGAVSRLEVQYYDNIVQIIYKKANDINVFDITANQTKAVYSGDIRQYASSPDGVYVFTASDEIVFADYNGNSSMVADDITYNGIPQFVHSSEVSYLLWCENADAGIRLCGIKETEDEWSDKLVFLSGDYDIVSPYANLTENGFSIGYIRRTNTNSLQDGDVVPNKLTCDLYISDILPTYNLKAEYAEYSGDGIITYTITNTGTEDINAFDVSISQNGNSIASEQVNEKIIAGGSITKEVIVDDFDENSEAILSVETVDVTDYTDEDNTFIFHHVGSDPQVLSAKLVTNEEGTHVEAEIVNTGVISNSLVKAELREGGMDGEIIYSESYENVLPNEKILFQYAVNDTTTDYVVCLTTQNDEKIWNNYGLCVGNNALQKPITTTTYKTLSSEYEFIISSSQTLTSEKVYLAIYDIGGRLLDLKIVDFDGESVANVSMPIVDSTAYAKIFVWNDSLQPLGNYEYIPLGLIGV